MSDYVPWFEPHQTCEDHIWETIDKANTFTLSLNFNKWIFFHQKNHNQPNKTPTNLTSANAGLK